MQFLRHFVWWKCLFWIALGAASGAAVASRWPESGVPSGATRVDVERFAVGVTANPDTTNAVTNVVLYPPHKNVQLITFDFRSNGQSQAAYAFGNMPFLTAERLQYVIGTGQKLSLKSLRASTLVYALGLRVAAEKTLADLNAQPHHVWNTADDFLNHIQTTRTGFTYMTPWWADTRWQYDLSVGIGVIVIGGLGSILTRRSEADLIAIEILRNARSMPGAAPVKRDLQDVVKLDELLEEKLATQSMKENNDAASLLVAAVSDPVPKPIATLSSDPLAATVEAPKEEKSYAGEFYPIAKRKGFSLVELLVVIGIIAVLIGLLMPTLIGARQSADTIVCASNLHMIGQGISIYLQQNDNTFPASYQYIGQTIVNGRQTPTQPSAGYVHWSSFLYSSGAIPTSAFTCPAMRLGGLPPTNTSTANRDPGQVCPNDAMVDQQAPRLAYTVNESLCPRNKFIASSFGAPRYYRFVKATNVQHSSSTILATEMTDNAAALSYGVEGTGWIMSHRPLTGFVGADGELDLYLEPLNQGILQVSRDEIDADPATLASSSRTRLDLVGRNHGKKTGYPDRRLSNFVYVDGHVETKSIFDTVQPFQWGDQCYSLVPDDAQVGPPD